MTRQRQSDMLLFWGVVLFLLGLITGFFIPALANPRMGLSSHLEGVMNGMFLLILGLIWQKLELSGRWLKATYWLALYGTFANWLGILLAAVLDGGKMLNVAAEGRDGGPAVEGLVTFLLVTLSLAMVAVCIAVLAGLAKHMARG